MKNLMAKFVAYISLQAKKHSSMASCFVFCYEPELPEEEQTEIY